MNEITRRNNQNNIWNEFGFYNPLNQFAQEVERIFGYPFWTNGDVYGNRNFSSAEVYEDGEDAVVRVELPGCTPENIHVDLNDNTLIISAKREKNKTQGEKLVHRERSFEEYSETIALPGRINSDSVSASYKNGILEIRIPENVAQKSKQIAIATE